MTASTMVSSKSVNPAFTSLLWGSLRVCSRLLMEYLCPSKNRAAFSLPIKEKALRGRKSGCRAPSGSTGRFRAAALSCRKLRFQSVCFCYPSVLLLSASASRKILASQFFFVPCCTLFSVLFLLSFPRYALDGGAKHFYVHQND